VNATAQGQRITRVALAILGLVLVVGVIIVAAALSSRPTAPTASISVHLQPDWHGKWKTGEPGVKFIPPSVTPPRRVVASFARDIESPALAKEAILRLGLRMTPDELLGNLTTPNRNRKAPSPSGLPTETPPVKPRKGLGG
jgi:hypothetical protein